MEQWWSFPIYCSHITTRKGVEVSAFPNFKQNNEVGHNTINVSGDKKLGARIGRKNNAGKISKLIGTLEVLLINPMYDDPQD